MSEPAVITEHLENRMLFREVNERIRDVNVAFGPSAPSYEVLCECGRRDCLRLLHVSSEAYEDARSDPRRFIVAEGHERPALEQVLVVDGDCRVVLEWHAAPTLAALGPAA